MTIWKRIRLFLVGVGLGLIIVYFYFGDRDLTSWTPQSRVIDAIDSAEVEIVEKANCQLNCLGISESQLDELYSSSTVDFSGSLTKEKPCPVYLLKTTAQEQAIEIMIEVCERENTAELRSIKKEGVSCECP